MKVLFCTPFKHSVPFCSKRDVVSLENLISSAYQKRYKSCDKDKCCIDPAPGQGKTGDPNPSAPWRTECPPNYDTYKIKVPNIMVPPLPPSNAKPMLDCTKTKSPCSVQAPPLDPPCPPPPRKPFPWIYIWPWGVFLVSMGAIYKLHLLREKWEEESSSKTIWRPRAKIKRPFHASDLPPCVQYLLIGAGTAAWSAYQAIKEHDPKAKVFFISKEDTYPYIRPPLAKTLWWNVDPPDINNLNYTTDMKRYSMYFTKCENVMNAVDFYRQKKGPAMSIATGWCVNSVDADNHVAYINTLGGVQPMYYERCLIATGSKALNLDVFKTAPKAVREKTITIRTIRDVEVAFRKVRAAASVTIVGGGILGSELAWHLGKSNDKEIVDRAAWDATEPPPAIEYNLVVKDKGVLSGFLPEYLGEYVAEKLRCENVNMITSAQVYDAYTTPDDRLELTLSNGKKLVTDFVIVAIGAAPQTDMARPSELETDSINGGFLVNTELMARTHLYCAGDAASFYSPNKDTRLRMEHYDNAETSGKIAGKNMTGYWDACEMEPHFWVRFGPELQIQVIGEVGACMPTIGLWKECGVDESERQEMKAKASGGGLPCFKDANYQVQYKRGILFYLRNNVIVGIVLWNIPAIEDRREVVQELLRSKPSYKDINMISELLGFPETECDFTKKAAAAAAKPLCLRGKEW